MTFIYNFGHTLHVHNKEIRPKEIQKLLAKIEGTPEEDLISRLALRSMKQAKYTPENTGHFGLATTYYCHFTSPIRRYPDLQIHRIIKETLRGKMQEGRIGHYDKILPEVAKHSSEMERRAEEAERETVKLKKSSIWSSMKEKYLRGSSPASLNGECMWNCQIRLKGLSMWRICKTTIMIITKTDLRW